MTKIIEGSLRFFERLIVGSLILMMIVVILLSTIELGRILVLDIITPPNYLLDINELLDIFGFFMLILIGVELLETIRAYLNEHQVHVEIVLEVALIAVARKVVIIDVKEYPPRNSPGDWGNRIVVGRGILPSKTGSQPTRI